MIRRLVKQEHVGPFEHDAAEEQPRGLAARERLGRLEAFLAKCVELSSKPGGPRSSRGGRTIS